MNEFDQNRTHGTGHYSVDIKIFVNSCLRMRNGNNTEFIFLT